MNIMTNNKMISIQIYNKNNKKLLSNNNYTFNRFLHKNENRLKKNKGRFSANNLIWSKILSVAKNQNNKNNKNNLNYQNNKNNKNNQ